MKQSRFFAIVMITTCTLIFGFGMTSSAQTKVTLNDFYRPFALSEITPKNMQRWPYYKYVSMHWDEYGLFGTVPVMGSTKPAKQGLKAGNPTGHRKAVINTKTQNAPGEVYNYNDKNTDLLAILAEGVTGKHFNKLLSDLFNDFGANSNGSIALTVDGTASPSYGISCTLRDYGLFHQWIAQGKAPKSFYASIADLDKDLYGKSEAGKGAAALLGTRVAYASQGWHMPEHKIIYTLGSYGQVGLSDLQAGISVVFMQDWEDNGVPEKYEETVARALFVIDQLNAK